METGNRDGMSRGEPIRAVGSGTGPYGSSVAVCLSLLFEAACHCWLLRYCSCDLSPSDGSLVRLAIQPGSVFVLDFWREERVCFFGPHGGRE